jgi:hypothetical protein
MLPVYEQPLCPEPNLMWMPGYWAYGDNDYYWVPGAWVEPPYEGALWTPDYWDWYGGRYRFHRGYWGRHVGYYGGVNYGYGYEGVGFSGGEWRGNQFAYNTAIMRVNENRIHTVYVDRTIVERNTVARDSHVAYSGGPRAACSSDPLPDATCAGCPGRQKLVCQGQRRAPDAPGCRKAAECAKSRYAGGGKTNPAADTRNGSIAKQRCTQVSGSPWQ